MRDETVTTRRTEEAEALVGLPNGSFTIRWDGHHGYRVSIPGVEWVAVVPADAHRRAISAERERIVKDLRHGRNGMGDVVGPQIRDRLADIFEER